jgi:hypothetical protein
MASLRNDPEPQQAILKVAVDVDSERETNALPIVGSIDITTTTTLAAAREMIADELEVRCIHNSLLLQYTDT